MSTTTRTRRARAIAAVCALGLLAAACGDDDDTATTATTAPEGETAGAELAEYCAATAELDNQDGPPTAEQMERIKELAPEEIDAEVEFVADAFIEADGDFGKVFADPEVEEQLGTIEEWEGEHCDGGDEFAVAPENQEYCDYVEELDSQEEPPSVEQIERLKELRPESIGEETDLVADAFIASGGDIGALFEDPAVTAAFEAMEEHDAEVCGFEMPEEEEEPDTEAAAGAEVVPVQAVDFGYEGIPAQVPSGLVAFEMENVGEAAHEFVLFKLGEGVDLDELLAAEEEPSPEEAEEVGGTFAPPGETAFANVELEPGDYAVVCFIPGPEGKPHYELGMKRTFQVS